jgi:outer membrane protein OmpA-like peptidoglycan-associated protein
MKCNWWRWLWGIVPLLVLSWVAVQSEHAAIQTDLQARAARKLSQAGLGWAVTRFDGRDAVLEGRAGEEADPQRAEVAVRGVWGVRVVDNNAQLLPKIDNYTWGASRHGQRIRLVGYVPNKAARQAILGVTKANFPGFEVVDRMTTARGAPAADAWLGGVSFALKQLASLKKGAVRVTGLGLTVMGESEDIAAYRAIKSALANQRPKGIALTEDGVTAPVASPFTWSAQFADGRLVLAGHVPEAVRAELLAAARTAFAGKSILDRTQPAEGAPQGWANAAAAGLRQLARLENGSLEMKDAGLVVSGLAADASTAETVKGALRGAMPATIALADHIKVREPPPPPTPPAPAPPAALPKPPPSPAEIAAKACEESLMRVAKAGLIAFGQASAVLDSASFPTLDKLAEAAKACPEMRIEVDGHASAEGSAELNKDLSEQRAQSVVRYLVGAGVESTQLLAVGYGATRPIAPNDTAESMAKNRRIEFTVRPK